MVIQFFNTLSGKQEPFVPRKAGEAQLYTCGPTVYDYAHIGNFRTFVFEDLLRRFLEFSGLKVEHVMNITDVDDKTIAGAVREKKPLLEYTEKFTQAFNEDMAALNCLAPTRQPRATKEIDGMLALIQKLLDKGIAYQSEGSVYYRVSKFPGYGKLSKKKLHMNIAGASERVDADEYDKEEVTDFVLWKGAKEGEPFWSSPWGNGRPGWHIECSAMSLRYLGDTFDIHAGGEDLIFPHHENEIAQSEAATGQLFVKYWLHSKHLLVDGEKMSKSKGNFYTLRDLIAKGHDPMAIRYALLSVHYRQQMNFTMEHLKEASEVIKKLDECYWNCATRLGQQPQGKDETAAREKLDKSLDKMTAWLADDLNVSGALAELSGAVTEINKDAAQAKDEGLRAFVQFLKSIDRLFGFDVTAVDQVPAEVQFLMKQRSEVRLQVKNDKSLWAKSDALRDEIQKLGWLVKDGKPGELSTLKKKRRKWD
ncbi:MAG TPA: cysteine--tRNA ligase [Verrucomicrobiae bacterium]|nr:cysteine--tRNA ligase [Verrucomicrobiae bacterium]